MWGQANLDSLSADNIGIIPTRVGTSSAITVAVDNYMNHPHACGDKQLATCFTTLTLGSSPRVWGQGVGRYIFLSACGIIPTRVGTSHIQ